MKTKTLKLLIAALMVGTAPYVSANPNDDVAMEVVKVNTPIVVQGTIHPLFRFHLMRPTTSLLRSIWKTLRSVFLFTRTVF